MHLDAWARFQLQCPDGVTEQAWRQAIDDSGRLLDKWGKLADSFGWTPVDLFDVPRDGAMGLAWWLKGRTVTALGPEHASVGQPAYDRVTRREWVNPYSRPVPSGLSLADPGASTKDHAEGSWPMSAHVLISGQLYRAPEHRVSKAGKPFVTATLKAKDGDESQGWKILAFSESIQAELLHLQDGDAISAQGAFKAELYDRDGEKRLSLSIVADNVLALRQPAKPRKLGETPRSASTASDGPPREDYNDALPF
jgi:Single-strand binding protein family